MTTTHLPSAERIAILEAEVACLRQLLEVQEQTVIEQTEHLEKALHELEDEREALFLSGQRIRSILEAALDAVIIAGRDGRILEWNSQAERLLGWTSADALGCDLVHLVLAPAHRADLRTWVDNPEGDLGARRLETTALYRGEREFPAEISIARLAVREEVLFSVFLRDIRAQREAQEHMKRARDEALAASRMKSQFLAVMSHELRTPMNGILPVVDLLKGTGLNAEQDGLAETVRTSAYGLLAVLNDVLELSQIEDGRIELAEAPFDLPGVVRAATEAFRPRAGELGLELLVDCPGETPYLFHGDQERLAEIVRTLVGNALKFTMNGSIRVRCNCGAPSTSGLLVNLVVEDTGVGIPADRIPTIFDKFTQADSSDRRRHGGTGLGLAIVKRLVELMGGSISVSSEVDHGTEFLLQIPFAVSEGVAASADAAGMTVEGAGHEQAAVARGQPVRILLAEDNLVNQRVISRLLQKLSFAVEVANNGQEAVEMHASGAYDLIFMDKQMPVMDGFEATAGIRALDGAVRHTPIVALTANALAGDREQCIEAGMDDYLSKPVMPAQLAEMVARWVREE